MSIKLFLHCIIFVLLLMNAQTTNIVNRENHLMNFSPNLHETHLIIRCLNNTTHFTNSGNKARCRKIRESVTLMSDTSSRSRIRRIFGNFSEPRDTNSLDRVYLSRIVDIRNQKTFPNDANDQIMRMVAPCARFSPSLERRWNKFFRKRTKQPRPRGFTLIPASQHLQDGVIHVAFNRPKFNTREFLRYDRVAVDLVLNRVSPYQIDEQYGSYTATVRKSSGNSSEESGLLVHISKQSSCPTIDGYMMVLSLNLSSTMSWFFEEDNDLALQVQLRPTQQLFTNRNRDNNTVNILRRVVSIMFSFHENSRATPRLLDLITRNLGNKDTRRHRRNLSVRRRKRNSNDTTTLAGCALVSYPINFQQISVNFIKYPISFDVKECSGRCDLSLLAQLNSTNHAMTMKLESTSNSNPSVPPTVDCVPTSYRDLQIWEIDSYGTLVDSYLRDMVARHCGCA